MLGALVFWVVLLLMIASNSLALTDVTELLWRIVLFVPKVIVAVLLVLFGMYLTSFVAGDLADYLVALSPGGRVLIERRTRPERDKRSQPRKPVLCDAH